MFSTGRSMDPTTRNMNTTLKNLNIEYPGLVFIIPMIPYQRLVWATFFESWFAPITMPTPMMDSKRPMAVA
jgi:hypothetical protein